MGNIDDLGLSRTSFVLAVMLTAAAPALAVEVSAFWDEFNSNGMAFRQKYVGRSVTVTGNAYVINGEVTPGYVSLTGGNNIGGMLICTVSNNASLLPLARGKPVSVTGTVKGVGPSGIQLQSCTVQ
jgi:hypothetical protein